MIENNPIMAKIRITILNKTQVMHEPGDSRASGYATPNCTRSSHFNLKEERSILISGLCLSCSRSVGIMLVMVLVRKDD